MAPGMAATSQYFNKKRGAAIGLAVAGSSLGGVIFPIALSKMLNNPDLSFGWTVRICAFLILAIIIPSTIAIRARLPPRQTGFFLPSAFKQPQYLALIGSALLMIIGTFIPLFYLPSYAVSYGMSQRLAFYLTAILNAASFFGRIIPGITADKVGRFNILCFFGIATGILALCWQKTASNAAIIVFSALYGFTSGAIVSLLPVCFAHVAKSPKDIGTYMGQGMLAISAGALIGPPSSGAIVADHHGSFSEASTFAGVFLLVGAFAVVGVKWLGGQGLLTKV